ncbi:MAG: ABC transporter substrate-binding protein [Rhodobacteraceae bacterium]|nr:ABC transporter substrate-binding protein [Paracoccaceae bacterium]
MTAASLNRESNIEVATLNAALARRARAARPVPEARIEILSPGGFSPVSEEDWPGGGLATQIIEAAFRNASQNKKVQIDFVGDREAHLALLLRYNKFEFGFPWTKPDCSRAAQLPEDSKLLCEYEFSDPVYVAAIKVYAPKNLVSPPRRFEDLRDSTLCRPAGVPVHDLYDHGLIDGQTVVIERPSSTELCFTMLERGEVDYVSDFQFPAEKALSDLSLSPYVDAIPGLVDAAPLHLIAHGDNAEAAYLLMDRFNAGLANLRASGEWDQIVNGQIRQFRGTIVQ